MPNIIDPQPTRLEGFNYSGIYVGCAWLAIPGDHWRVTITASWQHADVSCPTEEAARQLLRDAGAVIIRSSYGRK